MNPQLELVLSAVESTFKVTRKDILGPTRFQRIVEARMAYYLIAKEEKIASERIIAQAVKRSRSTVSFGQKRMQNLRDAYPKTRAQVEQARRMFHLTVVMQGVK